MTSPTIKTSLQAQIERHERRISHHKDRLSHHEVAKAKIEDALKLLSNVVEIDSLGKPLEFLKTAQKTSTIFKTQRRKRPVVNVMNVVNAATAAKKAKKPGRSKVPDTKPILAKPAKAPSALAGGRERVLAFLTTDPSKALGSGEISRTLHERYPDITFKTYQNAVHYLKSRGEIVAAERDDGWYYHRKPASNGSSAATL